MRRARRPIIESGRFSSQAFSFLNAAFTGYSIEIDKSNALINPIDICCEYRKAAMTFRMQP